MNRLDLDASTDRHRSLFTGLHSQNSTEQETMHQDKLRSTFSYDQAHAEPCERHFHAPLPPVCPCQVD